MRKTGKKKLNKSFIPNIFTVFNMFLGFMAVGMMIKGRPIMAGWLILYAGLFDAVDGKLARMIGIPSKFGTEFDSLADTISFCVAPSILLYTTYIAGLSPLIGGFISFIPLLFGTIRLAIFNLDNSDSPKSYFVGLPTPVTAMTIFGYFLFNQRVYGIDGDSRTALVIAIALGFLMVSKIRFSKFPILSFKKGKGNSITLIFVILILISLIIWKGYVLFPVAVFYITWNVINWMVTANKNDQGISIKTNEDI